MIYLSDPDRNTDGWRLVALFIGDGSMSVPVMQRGDTTDTVVVPDGMTADDAWEQNGLRVPLIVALTDDQFVTDSQAIDRRLAAQFGWTVAGGPRMAAVSPHLQERGLWNDPGSGRFVRRGWSSLKWLLSLSTREQRLWEKARRLNDDDKVGVEVLLRNPRPRLGLGVDDGLRVVEVYDAGTDREGTVLVRNPVDGRTFLVAWADLADVRPVADTVDERQSIDMLAVTPDVRVADRWVSAGQELWSLETPPIVQWDGATGTLTLPDGTAAASATLKQKVFRSSRWDKYEGRRMWAVEAPEAPEFGALYYAKRDGWLFFPTKQSAKSWVEQTLTTKFTRQYEDHYKAQVVQRVTDAALAQAPPDAQVYIGGDAQPVVIPDEAMYRDGDNTAFREDFDSYINSDEPRDRLQRVTAASRAALRDAGYTHVLVYRAAYTENDPFEGVLRHEPLAYTSWSTDRTVAADYMDPGYFMARSQVPLPEGASPRVFAAVVPVDQIISFDLVGFRSASRGAFVDDMTGQQVAYTKEGVQRLVGGEVLVAESVATADALLAGDRRQSIDMEERSIDLMALPPPDADAGTGLREPQVDLLRAPVVPTTRSALDTTVRADAVTLTADSTPDDAIVVDANGDEVFAVVDFDVTNLSYIEAAEVVATGSLNGRVIAAYDNALRTDPEFARLWGYGHTLNYRLQADVEALPDDREAAYQEAVASMTNWDASRADAYVPRSDRRAGPPVMRSAIQLTLESPNPDPQVVELMQRLHQLTADALGGRAVRLIRATDGAASFDDTTNSWWSYFPYEGSSSATTSWTNELFGATDFGSDFWFTEVDDQHVLFREGTIEHEFLVVTDSEVLDRLMVGPSAAPFMRPTDQSDLQVDLLALPPGEEVRGSGTREWFEREILPQRLLHMTNASRIASIAEHGIDPARGAMMSSPEAAPRPGVVYLANESKFDGGLSGNLGVDLLGLSEPVTLEIDPTKLDYSRFVPDEDDFTFMGDAAKRDAFGLPPYSDDQNPGQWARDANLGTQPGIMDALSATGPYPTSSYGYGGVIPPEAITRVRFEEGWSDTLRDWTEESDWMTLDEAVVEARRRFMDERVEASEEASDQAIDLLRRGTVTAPDGAHPATPEDRERLKIPPGWVDVFVADDPTNYRQVWARDAQGRSQGRYTAEYEARQEALKFERVKELAAKLDDLDNALVRDMMTDSAAAVTALIRHFGLRPGSMKDTRARKQAYGATTLQARHVRQYPDTGRTTLSFVGKSGQKITVSTRDPDIYRLMQHWTDGKQGTDFLFEATDADVRAYLTGAIGPGFLAKDLRTLKANVMALEMVRSMRRPTTMTAFRKARNKVADAVAKALGNTRAVTLSGYINPTVFADWEDRLL